MWCTGVPVYLTTVGGRSVHSKGSHSKKHNILYRRLPPLIKEACLGEGKKEKGKKGKKEKRKRGKGGKRRATVDLLEVYIDSLWPSYVPSYAPSYARSC